MGYNLKSGGIVKYFIVCRVDFNSLLDFVRKLERLKGENKNE